MAQLEYQVQFPALDQASMVEHTCNLSLAGGVRSPGALGHLWAHETLSLKYMKPIRKYERIKSIKTLKAERALLSLSAREPFLVVILPLLVPPKATKQTSVSPSAKVLVSLTSFQPTKAFCLIEKLGFLQNQYFLLYVKKLKSNSLFVGGG